jgi:transposase-like protein
MSTLMEDDIKRWTAKRKTALVLDIIQGKTTMSEASRAFDLNPSEVEQWVDEDKRDRNHCVMKIILLMTANADEL